MHKYVYSFNFYNRISLFISGVIPHHQPPIQTSHPPPSSVAATSTPAAPCLVLDELKSTNNYNPREFDLNPAAARFFVVKSYSEDDIHRKKALNMIIQMVSVATTL